MNLHKSTSRCCTSTGMKVRQPPKTSQEVRLVTSPLVHAHLPPPPPPCEQSTRWTVRLRFHWSQNGRSSPPGVATVSHVSLSPLCPSAPLPFALPHRRDPHAVLKALSSTLSPVSSVVMCEVCIFLRLASLGAGPCISCVCARQM